MSAFSISPDAAVGATFALIGAMVGAGASLLVARIIRWHELSSILRGRYDELKATADLMSSLADNHVHAIGVVLDDFQQTGQFTTIAQAELPGDLWLTTLSDADLLADAPPTTKIRLTEIYLHVSAVNATIEASRSMASATQPPLPRIIEAYKNISAACEKAVNSLTPIRVELTKLRGRSRIREIIAGLLVWFFGILSVFIFVVLGYVSFSYWSHSASTTLGTGQKPTVIKQVQPVRHPLSNRKTKTTQPPHNR